MSRVFSLLGGVVFVASLVYFAISYVWRFDAPSLWRWSWSDAGRPILADFALFTLFALHHSIFARLAPRSWVERIARPELERSIYVWVSSVLFLLVCGLWQPVPGVLWRVNGAAADVLRIVQIAGGVLILAAARRLDTLALAGVRQAFAARKDSAAPGRPPQADAVLDRGPYRLVRHPIYLGWFAAVWCPPLMNGTRLVFAAVSCLYLVMAIPFEERDLRRVFGAAYAQYARRVRWRMVPGVY